MSCIGINNYNKNFLNSDTIDISMKNSSNNGKINQSVSNNQNLINKNTNDTIDIQQKSEILINTKKAYDAFKETNKEYGLVDFDGTMTDMSVVFGVLEDFIMMESKEGVISNNVTIPTFDFNQLNGTNKANENFLDFIDKIKDFAKLLNKRDKDKPDLTIIPDSFFDFCDSYKQKLKEYGCT